MAVEGVDYAGDLPSVSGLAAAGKKFVVRYGGPGGSWKHLTATELRALTAAGIAVVANAEGTAQGFKGRDAGRSWAQQADSFFRGLGMPAGRPIYFSADWDVPSSQYDDVDAALRGAAEVIGAARVGLYGGYDIIRHAQSAGTARWFWQTYAWSEGRWASGVHIQQYRNGVSLAGGTVDLNRAMTADYGQWGAGAPPAGEDDMLSKDEWSTVAGYDVLTNGYGDAPTNPTIALKTFVKNVGADTSKTWAAAQRIEAATKTIAAKIDALAATGDNDVLARIDQRHAEALKAITDAEGREVERDKANVAALVAALPGGGDPITREELEAALRSVYGQAFSGDAPQG